MNQWIILFNKEMKEAIRNFKWIWIPLVFILLGIIQPVTSYFLPDILKNFGGFPEGSMLEFPLPTGPQVLAETIGQFGQIGVLVIVLAFMGIVAGERNSGTNIMVLVKPVSYVAYIVSKWLHMSLLAISSFSIGFLLASYYTFQLIESVPISYVIKGAVVYSIWLLFVTTLVLFFSVLFKSNAGVAALTLGITIIISLMSSITPDLLRWSPGMIASHSHSIFQSGEAGEYFWLSISCTIVLIILMIILSIINFKNKETVTHTT
ncbi:ABC transporter permease subunit [Evansella sp. AB-P1]|uniref:ABC transporter permease n=1 Tax=Evansella sp. AB-P1 TaxID=3037653 RepID=UPI00241D092E|nr:ABC transporter permease subunit [Evansella sp. AB-P1]MDG5790086.1 ABC transporter permease subunit [Evansella sp. AB-P1]